MSPPFCRCHGRMGRAKRNPSFGGEGCDGFRLAPPPILRATRCRCHGRMGRAKRNPSFGGEGCDGFRLAPLPILRAGTNRTATLAWPEFLVFSAVGSDLDLDVDGWSLVANMIGFRYQPQWPVWIAKALVPNPGPLSFHEGQVRITAGAATPPAAGAVQYALRKPAASAPFAASISHSQAWRKTAGVLVRSPPADVSIA